MAIKAEEVVIDVTVNDANAQQKLAGTERAVASLRREKDNLAKSSTVLARAQEQVSGSMGRVSQAIDRATGSTGRLTKEIKQSVTQAREAVGSLGSSFGGLTLGLGAARAGLVALANPLTAVVVGVAALAIGAALGGERIANLQNMFLGTSRSLEELAASFQLVTTLARDTGQSAEQLGQRYIQLTQQGRALGLSQEQINENFERFERAIARFRVPTIAQAAQGALNAFTDMLAGFDRLLGVSKLIVGLFDGMRDVIQTIARWLPAQATAAERLAQAQTQHNRALARHEQHIEEIRRGSHDFWLVERQNRDQNLAGLSIEELRMRAIANIQAEINRLRGTGFRTQVLPAITPEQQNVIDGITVSISRAMQHWLGIGNLLQHQQEVRNQLYQIELQLIQAGLTAEEARVRARQLQGNLEITQAAQQFQSIRQSLLTQETIELESYARRILMLQTFGQQRADLSRETNALIEAEHHRHQHALQQIAFQQTQMWVDAFARTAQVSQELFQVLGQKSKAFAVAAIVVGKGLAIAQTIQQGTAASMAALAPPPVGLGPVAGAPLSAAIKGLTAANVGIIAATGILQGASALSGPSAPSIGSGGAAPGAEAAGTMPQMIVIELEKGGLFSSEQVAALLDQLSEAVDNGSSPRFVKTITRLV